MLAKKLLSAAKAVEPVFIESVFSTWLYTGNGSTQTITNGIDLSGKGGMVMLRGRATGTAGFTFDTAQGVNKYVLTNSANGQASNTSLTTFNSNGFSLSSAGAISVNDNGNTYVSWTFRKQPKFFDVVTYTGDGTSGLRYINQSLGSAPGFIIVKKTSSTGDWFCYSRGLPSTNYSISLNLTDAATDNGLQVWDSTTTQFAVHSSLGLNANGATYVAYIFAHNAGGFGLTGTDNVISCGSFTTDSSGNATVNLGYEPQWVTIKCSSAADAWYMTDNMRGWSQTATPTLLANSAASETANAGNFCYPTATGFEVKGFFGAAAKTYIYIAIRRGPMRTPTSGTSVYTANTYGSAGDSLAPAFRSSFPVDFALFKNKSGALNWREVSRLTGTGQLSSNTTDAETTNALNTFDFQNGWFNDTGVNSSVYSWMFRRAPGFFDEVCYTGTGSARTVAHNLAAVPELMIVKSRNNALDWYVYHADIGNTKYIRLNIVNGAQTSVEPWNNTTPTASVFTTGIGYTNESGYTYVAYLFATCPGVSKVGSYTGTGTTQQINCGFTSGARFVLIKATSTTGNWLVWDVARGLVAGNDPYLALNSTAAEVTTTDWVDPYSAGFELSNASGNLANTNGVSYIFFAVS